MGVSDYLPEPIQLAEILKEAGYDAKALKIHQDNMSTIKLLARGKPASENTRHINIRYFFIKDRVDCGEVQIEYCPTDEIPADALTKPLVGDRFYKHRHWLLGCEGRYAGRGVLEYPAQHPVDN